MPLTITEEMIKQDPFFQEGVKRVRKEAIQKLHLKGNFPPEEIAELLEVSLEFVNKAIAELQKEKEEK
ncbi:hypothetical protein [Desulfurobacterium crinifex]